MSQSSDSSKRALATLVTALGITIGATPATLHAQAPAKTPTREAVQSKHKPEAAQDKEKAKEAVQDKVAAKEASQNKISAKEAVQGKQNAAVQNKVGTPAKAAVQGKAPVAAPAKPL
jgi:hypothetical protein